MTFNRFFLVIQFLVLLVPLGLVYLIGLAVLTAVQFQEGEIFPTLLSIFLLSPFLVAAFRIVGCAIRGAESLQRLSSRWWLVSSVAVGASIISILIVTFSDFGQFGEMSGTLIATMSIGSVLTLPFLHCAFLRFVKSPA